MTTDIVVAVVAAIAMLAVAAGVFAVAARDHRQVR
jgi:hypothetical protein